MAFRILLLVMFVSLFAYTALVITEHGFSLIPIFFGDIAKMGWPGQFNADFMGFLILSGTWLAWRHHFSGLAIALFFCGLFGGIMFLAPYLFFASLKAKGDMKEILMGKTRANA